LQHPVASYQHFFVSLKGTENTPFGNIGIGSVRIETDGLIAYRERLLIALLVIEDLSFFLLLLHGFLGLQGIPSSSYRECLLFPYDALRFLRALSRFLFSSQARR
jgi:hypothetical protein